uniref:Uncharacterized protein n=1 Tax=Sphaerodactylus townsendi TaxID=933632 RepID=A0ACB8EQR9_9SAUR
MTEIAKRLNTICAQVIPFLSQEHQQQVAQAVERAKQVTMAELNAIIGGMDRALLHVHIGQQKCKEKDWQTEEAQKPSLFHIAAAKNSHCPILFTFSV